jgi:hypothetical protein
LYFLTEQPAPGVQVRTGGFLPGFVYIGVSIYFLLSLFITVAAAASWRRWKHRGPVGAVAAPRTQAAIWIVLMAVSLAAACRGIASVALMALFLAQLLPRVSGR